MRKAKISALISFVLMIACSYWSFNEWKKYLGREPFISFKQSDGKFTPPIPMEKVGKNTYSVQTQEYIVYVNNGKMRFSEP